MPAVRAIKAGRPDAHITVAAPEKIAPVWKLVPEVDEVISLTSGSLFSAVGLIRRQTGFDVAILFPNSLRAALEVWLAGVPRRVGYRGHHREWLLNQIIPERSRLGPVEHQVHHYLQIARDIGGPAEPPAVRCFCHERNQTARPRKSAFVRAPNTGPPSDGSGTFRRGGRRGFSSTAGPMDSVWHGRRRGERRDHRSHVGANCVDRIGKTTLQELIAELGECALLLTNDTGTMHLATILGVPVVAVFGSTEPRLTGPLGSGLTLFGIKSNAAPAFCGNARLIFAA